MALADALTLKHVRELAGDKTFVRGLAYFHEGAVGLLEIEDDQVRSRVQGTHTYRVTLATSPDGELEYDCTCPVGAEGDFCKHAVAVTLSWLENSGEESFPAEESAPSGKPHKRRKTQADLIAKFLAAQPEAALRKLLMEAAARDRGLRNKLLMQASAANIARAGSKARNPLIAQNLREFPIAPNIDAGEGVKMMFAEMAAAQLYPPQYRQNTGTAVESVTVTLLNLERPSVWDEVSDWLDRHGAIANADLCRIAGVDTLKASKMFAAWREQGLLAPLPDRAKRNMAYIKATQQAEQPDLLSEGLDNKGDSA